MDDTSVKRPTERLAVRLELVTTDHARLERAARARGLTMASYSRQAVLAAIKADERAATDTTTHA
jgi:hypothetical protein